MTDFDLTTVELFSGLSAEDLHTLQGSLTDRSLQAGEILFLEGDEADDAYVVCSGEVEILKGPEDRQVRIAVSGAGVIVGEMALLTDEPRNATARAIGDTVLVVIPRRTLREVLETSAPAVKALFDVFLIRWREQELRVRQSERMAQLGVLTAGLAHEMNNPAAAVTRGTKQLRPVLDRFEGLLRRLPPDTPTLNAESDLRQTLTALDRTDREEELESLLKKLGVADPWVIAPSLVAAGVTEAALTGLSAGESLTTVIEAFAMREELRQLLAEVQEGARRLSELVAALKSYSFLDRAPVQETDIVKGIENTLLILKSKTADITVRRRLDELPPITAHGSQLNQVWTNLIDNAADALLAARTSDPTITLLARQEGEHIVVQVEDNGPGIPRDVIDHVFEAFYTTKAPGAGTGIGLNTVYGIVVNDHRGTIDVESAPGRTVFTVRIPHNLEPG